VKSEAVLDTFEITAEERQPIDADTREHLVEPFISAVSVALAEMTGTEVVVQDVYRGMPRDTSGYLAAVVALTSSCTDSLVMSFPRQTAAALARQMLAEAADQPDESLIRDCVGEMGNVIAGQAKAMLAGTPHQFAFSIPKVVECDESRGRQKQECLVVAFNTAQGEFTMRLIPKL